MAGNYIAIGLSAAWGLDAALEGRYGWALAHLGVVILNIMAVVL